MIQIRTTKHVIDSTTGAVTGAVLCLLPITVVAGTVAVPTTLAAATVDAADDATRADIQVTEVARRGESVTGKLVNRSGAVIRDIRLLIDMPFLWANELKPGDESPARSAVLTVQGTLEPHGTLAFEFTPNPPLPDRTDGHFGEPRAHVLGYETITAR